MTSVAGRLFLVTVAVLALALSGCAKARQVDDVPAPAGVPDDRSEDDRVGDRLDDGAGPGDDGDQLEDDTAAVFDDPEPFLGTTVTVTGIVNEVVDQNAFEIGTDQGSAAGFLVLVAGDTVEINDVVEVTGTVRRPDFEELAAELDFELDEDLYSPADRQVVIVADAVEVVPR